MSVSRYNVLGVGVSALTLAQARDLVLGARNGVPLGYVCVTPVHAVDEARRDPAFRKILNESYLTTPDGMPMVWVGRMQGYREMSRVYGPDLMLALFELSEKRGFRHFFYGGANGAAEALRSQMQTRFPAAQVVGVYEPPFRPLTAPEQEDLARQIQASRPDIVWVGLSTPKQEKFMAEYLGKLDTTLMIGVGAAFDMHSGRLAQAPRWMQRSGLEWFYRLCREPRRLWKRYLTNNPLFVLRIFLQFTKLKRYPLD